MVAEIRKKTATITTEKKKERNLAIAPILYCACAQTATFGLPIKTLTSSLDSATPIS